MFCRLAWAIAAIWIMSVLALTGCGGTENETSSNTGPQTPNAFKVAMIIGGPIDDNGWGQVGYEGLKLIEKELGAEIAYAAAVADADAENLFRQYAKEGFDFVIGHGAGYPDAAKTVAEEFPRTKFAVVTSFAGNNKNLGALTFRSGEIGYLAGTVAALKTKTNKVAWIGAFDYPVLREQATFFERGAKTMNPEIEVSIKWVESWTDQAKAREVAQALIESGYDVLLGNADTAALGIIDAAEKAGVYAIAVGKDQHELAPATILTSLMLHVPELTLRGAIMVQKGRWEGKQYKLGLREGVHELAPFYGLLTPEEEGIVIGIRDKILLGEIDTSF